MFFLGLFRVEEGFILTLARVNHITGGICFLARVERIVEDFLLGRDIFNRAHLHHEVEDRKQ